MPLQTTDHILAPGRGSPEVFSRNLSIGVFTRDYLAAIARLADTVGIDRSIPWAMWALETANGTSARWKVERNPAGLGIVASDTKQPFVIPTADEAARLHLQALYALVMRERHPGLEPVSPDLRKWLDDVWMPKVRSAAMPDVRTVHDLGLRYVDGGRQRATWSWEDGVVPPDTYGRKLVSRMGSLYPALPNQGGSVVTTTLAPGSLTFGRVPRPAMTVLLVDKPIHSGSAYGYDYVPGGRKIIGVVHHETQGYGTGQFYRDFFSCPNGERCKNALVDFLIDRAGRIFMLNDPFGNRAGWANGGGVGEAGGLEGDGPAFYAKFGANGINTRLVSIEYEKLDGDNFTQAQIDSGGALAAWIHDQDRQPWSAHPYVPQYGCVTSFLHFEFGTTNCGKGELDDISKVQAVTKGIMKQYQTSSLGGGEPIPPDVPPLPEPALPGGISLAEAVERFGKIRRTNLITGKVDTGLGFHPKGAISLGWANRAAREKVWPEGRDWVVIPDETDGKDGELHIITFENDWIMARSSLFAGFQWVTFSPARA